MLPVLFEDEVRAVIELASLTGFTASHLAFLEQLTGSIGIVLNTIEATMRTEGLLKQSQELAAELQAQQKELQQTNEELGQKAQQLAAQNAEVERKNQEIDQARRAVEEKAAELALTSRYKSEFLANMSHELRTPLNSILILGQQLGDNAEGNLTPKQREFAKTIHGAGTDLLNLISDILDLSKIESGTVTVESEEVPFAGLRETLDRNFRHVAEARKLAFTADFDPRLGRAIVTDSKRLMQVLKNLLSNAFKFTDYGGVRLEVAVAGGGWSPDHPTLSQASTVVRFTVSDTGIGIPAEKQKIIFEAFQQADAGTSRRYGGTGLGLAISRELAHLLGGEIRLQSVPGTGSTFTLYLPLVYAGPAFGKVAGPAAAEARKPFQPVVLPAPRAEQVPDDREVLQPGDEVLLIVEDDPHYARVLLGLARDRGFKGLVAMRGAEALELARKHLPTAISLDIFLPDMLGWTVLSQLKQDAATRHIPVQIITVEEERQHGLERGAFAYLNKPLTTEGLEAAFDRIKRFAAPRARRLLVVEDSPAEQLSIVELIAHDDVEITTVGTGEDALAALRAQALRLRRARPAAAGHLRLRSAHRDPARPAAAGGADRRVHRQGAQPGRGGRAAEDGEEHRAQGRPLAGAPARRDRALPAPRGRRAARAEAADAGAPARERRGARRQAGAGGGRRRAQHLRAVERARAPRHARRQRDDRPGGDRPHGAHTRSRARPDGHHDARDGRLRDDAAHPRVAAAAPAADHRADREGDEGRPREVPRGRGFRLHREAGQHRAAAVAPPHLAPSVTT